MGFANRSDRRYSWDDYRAWGDGERWEIIGGEPYCMSPAPTSRHQAVVGDLFALLRRYQTSRCRAFVSPIDVKLSQHDVVQPDIVMACDPSQITETHIEGPPTLVVEVLSSSTSRHDRIRKLRLYAKSGVAEYWLVQPNPPLIEVLQLVGDSYRIAGVFTEKDTLRSPRFPELAIDLSEAFTLPVPPEEQVDEIRESAPPYAGGAVT